MGNPEKLGRYEIVRHLANGGMAQVLLARTTGIGGFERFVVVKRIHAEQAKNETFVKMFLDEARLSAMLHHGNVVQVHEVGEDNGTIFFAMEYVHGEDVRRLLTELSKRREKPPLEHVIAIVSATADALHHAHEQHGTDGKPLGLVHRDVTPANIIVGYDGIVKVVDFGIAKAAIRSSETQAGMLKGKVAYMAPEQCTGKPVDRRSDVFALGVVLYELACVKRLFKGDNEFLTMSAIVDGKIPPPSQHRADLPKGLEKIILKALAMKPEDRYQSAGDMGADLERFASAIGLRPTPKGLAAYMKSKFGTKREPWLANDEPEISLTADFDGSASGVVSVPTAAVEDLAIPQEIAPTPSAPIMRMRKKAQTGQDKPLPAPFAAKSPAAMYEVPSIKRKSEPIAAVTPPRDPTPLPGVKMTPRDPVPLPGVTPRRDPTPLPGAAKKRSPTASIVVDEALGATPLAKVEDGWGASSKEVTPSLGALAPVFPDGVPPAVATVAIAEPGTEELAPAMDVAVPNTPKWKKAVRDRRVQIGGGVSAFLMLLIVTHCGSKKTGLVPRPAAEADVVAPAAAAAPAPVTAAPAPDPVAAAPAPDPDPAPATPPPAPPPPKAVTHAAAPHPKTPAKAPPAKPKRPKPKTLF